MLTDDNIKGIRLGVVRGISYGLFGAPDQFVPQARALGAGLVRAYVYWQQVEPEPGKLTWNSVDALLEQLSGEEEVWLTVCSSSRWATRQATDFLPPSAANDQRTYARFVRELVRHCASRVKYWQCENEPSNTGLLWAGTATEYVAQLASFYRAVKACDPQALVVLGGCGYDVWSSPEAGAPRQFFEQLVRDASAHFDLFSVHLYGAPENIPSYVETARSLMRRYGCDKPIVAGEYGGPTLLEFPELAELAQTELASALAEAPKIQSSDALIEQAGKDTPERRAMLALYARMPQLPERLQMFMAGCPPELEALRERISCRQIVMRNMLALAAGIRRTAYWNLAPEVPGAIDHYQIMHLMFGKMTLLDYEGRELSLQHPGASAFALLAQRLRAAERVTRLPLTEWPSVWLFQVERGVRGPLWVIWDERDAFDGENQPALELNLVLPPALSSRAHTIEAIDVFHASQPIHIETGRITLSVSCTPLFIQAR